METGEEDDQDLTGFDEVRAAAAGAAEAGGMQAEATEEAEAEALEERRDVGGTPQHEVRTLPHPSPSVPFPTQTPSPPTSFPIQSHSTQLSSAHPIPSHPIPSHPIPFHSSFHKESSK